MPRSTRAVIIAGSVLSLLPLFACWPQFRRLFFFHDDWTMLDEAARFSLGRWLTEPFLNEGVFPLFKLLWIGAVRATGGSYFGMILLLWLTHVAICLLFGWLLYRFGLPPAAIAFALVVFGLSWTNIETLGWSMQWNSQLAIVFFLAAWHFLLRSLEGRRGATACFLFLLASGLCWRGIISGVVLAVFVLLATKGRERVRLSILCVAPTVLLVVVMWLFVPRHEFSAAAALAYAWHYLLLNPLFRPLPIPRHGFEFGALLICGAIKGAVFVWAFRKAGAQDRPLLGTLVFFDLVVAVGLGYGRWSTGLSTVTSSRYQYIPLLCFGPMAGILVARFRKPVQVALLLLCACGLAFPWKRHADQWAAWRGSQLRAAIQQAGSTDRFDPSPLTAGRARELIRIYGLH